MTACRGNSINVRIAMLPPRSIDAVRSPQARPFSSFRDGQSVPLLHVAAPTVRRAPNILRQTTGGPEGRPRSSRWKVGDVQE